MRSMLSNEDKEKYILEQEIIKTNKDHICNEEQLHNQLIADIKKKLIESSITLCNTVTCPYCKSKHYEIQGTVKTTEKEYTDLAMCNICKKEFYVYFMRNRAEPK